MTPPVPLKWLRVVACACGSRTFCNCTHEAVVLRTVKSRTVAKSETISSMFVHLFKTQKLTFIYCRQMELLQQQMDDRRRKMINDKYRKGGAPAPQQDDD